MRFSISENSSLRDKMFGKKKAPPEQNSRTSRNRGSLSQFGLFDMPQDFDPSGAGGAIPEPTEADLEAELAMLVGGGGKASKKPEAKKRTAIPEGQLNSMVAACMKDYDSDEDIAVDENDDELLGELEGLASDQEEEVSAPIHSSQPAPQPKIEPLTCHGGDIGAECAGQDLLSIIDNRISCYSEAERNAKAAGETGRARRFARGLATLTDQRRKVLSGKAVNDADIPPAVVITAAQSSKKPSPVSTPPDEHQPLPSPLSEPSPVAAPTKPLDPNKLIQPISSPIEENLRRVQQRRTECRSEALKAKETGDKLKALACVNAVKECNALLEKINAGQTVDISNLPEIPTAVIQYPRGEPEPRPPPPAPEQQFSRDDPIQMPENPEDLPPVDPSVYGAPPPPRTVQEALEQRLAKYRQDEEKAKAENNSSRARRLGRICKQYTDAMKAHKAGRPIPVEDLPTPPGFAPIPTGAPAAPRPAAQVAPPKAAGAASAGGDTVPPQPARATPTAPAAAAKPAQKKPTTLRDKQILLLTSRQAEFKKAALEAKKSGQIEQAKEYLRQYKGFDQMIEAAKSGLPIDFKTLPVPPGQGSGRFFFRQFLS